MHKPWLVWFNIFLMLSSSESNSWYWEHTSSLPYRHLQACLETVGCVKMPFLVHQALAMSLLGSGASHARTDASGLRDGLPQPLGLGLPQCLNYTRAQTFSHTTAAPA